MEHLFVYGTLRDAHVQQSVFGRTFDGTPDTLIGYRMSELSIDGEDYPCAVPAEGGVIEGVVYGISSEDLAHADAYEGAAYERIKVMLNSGTEAWVYSKKI